MRKLMLLLCLMALSCSSAAPTRSIQESEDSRTTTVVELHIPNTLPQTHKWIREELPKYCKELEIPLPPKIRLRVSQIRGDYHPIFGLSWAQGLYWHTDKSIDIWLVRAPFGDHLTFDEIKEVILHELLHYSDDVKGLPKAPLDHNKIFHARLKKLGWI